MKTWKDNIFLILVEPKEPGNIGASARAMKNMGFKNLELVNPVQYLTDEARSMACVHRLKRRLQVEIKHKRSA